MKKLSFFLVAVLLTGCSSMGMSGGSGTASGESSYGTTYGSGAQRIDPTNPNSPYYGD